MSVIDKIKNSDKLELNQRPKDNRETLQSLALPTELLSESIYYEDYLNKLLWNSALYLVFI